MAKEQLQEIEERVKTQREGLTYNDYKIDTEEDAKANSMGYKVKI